ncbi:MAG: hypothetical protein ACTHOE_08970 [Conexibacter sp.]
MSGAVRRRTILFEAAVLADAERLSAERGVSLSTFVNAAVEHWVKEERGRKLTDEGVQRFDPIPESVGR